MVCGRKPVCRVLRVGEVVINDAVVRREETSGDRIVVGKGDGWEDGNETFISRGSFRDQAADVWGGGFKMVAEAEAIEREDDDDGMGELRDGAGFKRRE